MHEERITTGCVTSRNVLFVVVDDNDEDDDNTSIRKTKGASVRRKEFRARVEGKFEIQKHVFSPAPVPRTRFRRDSISRTWAVFDDDSKLSSEISI